MSIQTVVRGAGGGVWFLLLSALTAASGAAQEEVRTITFGEAVRIALQQNTALKLAENAAALDAVTVRQEKMQLLPNLSLSTRTDQSYGRYFNQNEGQIFNETTESLSTGVSSSVVVFDGFNNITSLRAARLAENAGRFEVARARQTVVFTVMSNFLSLVEQQEQLRVRQENLAAQEALEAQVQAYVDAGVRSVSDLYQQQANVASARLALVEARRAIELAKTDLIQTLQLDPFGEYEFAAPSIEDAPASAEDLELETLLRRAFEQRADLDAGEVRVSAAEQGVKAAKASRWPTLSLTAGYNTGYTSANNFGFWDQLDQRRGGSFGLGISIPLFDRGSTRAATERARIQAENARISLEDLRQEVGLQVRRAYLDSRAAQEQFRAAEAQSRASERALETTRERYEVGAATLVELTQIRADLVQAASALASARYNLAFQQRLIDYYLGELDPEHVSLD